MPRSFVLGGTLALAVLALVGFAAWIASLPAATATPAALPVPRDEAQAMLAALRPRHERPLVAVVALNEGTETTDYLVPTGILRRSGVAEVIMLATHPGPVQLYPALKVQPDATIAAFDAAHPGGADYVIVPAMARDDDVAVLAWLRSQEGKGATIVGVCAGAKIVGASGLLDGKRATTHWYYLGDMLERSPRVHYVANRRMVVDGRVATTTGITASMPMMLTLVEAIAGRARAESVARDLGLASWDARHASAAFALTRPFALTVLANRLSFWHRDSLGIRLAPGMDEISLALVVDAWSRTYRSSVTSFASTAEAVEIMHGVRVVPDRSGTAWPEPQRLLNLPDRSPADALDQSLAAIAARYGSRTAEVVAMQLEYPKRTTRP